MDKDNAAIVSAWVSIIELILLVIGGILGYVLISRDLTAIDVSLKNAEKRLADLKIERETAAVARLDASHVIQATDDSNLEYLTLRATVSNAGLVPLTIEAVRVEVSEGVPKDEIKTILEKGTVDVEVADTADDAQSEQQRVSEKGNLFPVSITRVDWKRRKELDEQLIEKIVLQPGQERSFNFGFIFENPATPRWYKFLISANTVSNHKTHTKARGERLHVVRLGPFPIANRYVEQHGDVAAPPDEPPVEFSPEASSP